MELLIPGLILVALMAWASTKIKKRAADAFEAETVETDAYSLRKPEGFLHLIGADDHEFSAYSREFGEEDASKVRRATIEMDVLPRERFEAAREEIIAAAVDSEIAAERENVYRLITHETANGIALTTFYKLVRSETFSYRLRFAVIADFLDDFLERIKTTLDSFEVK